MLQVIVPLDFPEFPEANRQVKVLVARYESEKQDYGCHSERTIGTLNEMAEKFEELKAHQAAMVCYDGVRSAYEGIGYRDVKRFCELESSIARTSEKCGKQHVIGNNRIEQNFRYYEQLLEEVGKDEVDEVSERIESTYVNMKSEISDVHVISLRMGRLLGYLQSLRGDYKTSLQTYKDIFQKCLTDLDATDPSLLFSCLDASKTLRDACDSRQAEALVHHYFKGVYGSEIPLEDAQRIHCELGDIAFGVGDKGEAVRHYEYVTDSRSVVPGPESRPKLHARRMRGNCFFTEDSHAEALEMLIEVYDEQKLYWPAHRDILLTMGDIAEMKKALKDYDGAMDMYKAMCQMSACTRYDFIHIEKEIAVVLTKQHKLEEAVERFKILLEMCEETAYPKRYLTSIKNGLAEAYCEQGRYEDAIKICDEVIKERKEAGLGHLADTLNAGCIKGRAYARCRYFGGTLAIYEETLALRRAIFCRWHPDCLSIGMHIAELLESRNSNEEAFGRYCEIYDMARFLSGYPLKVSEVEAKMRIVAAKIQDTELIAATRNNEWGEMERCLYYGSDVNGRDSAGLAPLHIACQKGSDRSLLLLLNYGAIYNIRNWDSQIPKDVTDSDLILGILRVVDEAFLKTQRCEPEHVERLFASIRDNYQQTEATVNAKDRDVATLLHYACANHRGEYPATEHKDPAKIRNRVYLVTFLARLSHTNFKTVKREGYLPLHHAAWWGYEAVLHILLAYLKCNSESVISRVINDANNDSGSTPLHFAALRNSEEAITILLQAGANRNIENKLGQKPIDLARDKEVKALLDKGLKSYI